MRALLLEYLPTRSNNVQGCFNQSVGLLMTLDALDKKIITYLSTGTSSYEELANLCGVSRNTIYRRIVALEEIGAIRNKIRCTINYSFLDITPVFFGAKAPAVELDKTSKLLAANKNVKFLWKTYGNHNIIAVAFCQKGREGEMIQSINAIFESHGLTDIVVSTGFTWEKMDFAPFNAANEIEAEISKILEEKQ
jgi:DNA-binding Lrp family transcriptional regulator